MATGGGMSRSIDGSSDVIHDFSCTPCAEDGKNTEAVHYCVNCETYFCQTCVLHHNKVFKSHNLLDKDAMVTAAKQTKEKKEGLPLPIKECEDHPGNIVQMYCETHDVCCCTVCIASEHRACKNADFIPKLARGVLKSKERQTVKSSLEKIRGELLQLKSKKEDELTELKKTKQDILEEIQQLKERLIVRVNELERKSRDEVCERYEKIAEKVNNDIDTLNDLLQSAEAQLKSIEQTQSNESELFVAIKHGKKFESTCKSVRQLVTQNNVKMLPFVVSKDTERFLNNPDSFGKVTDRECGDHPYSASLIGQYNVNITEDNKKCCVYDFCVLDDGQYIITDDANNKIKRLDETYNVTDWCTVPAPWGVCKTGTNEVAVTLFENKEVAFISIGRKFLGQRSFKVGFHCRGITYNDGKLFIGGSRSLSFYKLLKGNISDVIKIYNLAGSLLRSFKPDNSGNDIFGLISHVTFSLQDSYIYIADREKGLITLDTQGNMLSVVTDKRLKKAFGVSAGERSQLFLCDNNTGSVFQLNKHNGALQEILTQSDGLQNPISVTFIHKLKQLVVTCHDTNTIKVFQLI